MKYGSVCSGIEAATQAWHHMGWKPSFFSEIDAFPCAVLQHHYPKVPLHGDFTTIQDGDYEPINLLVGGNPCQSFSVAGLRKGLDDPRGNLMLGFGALAKRLRPTWLVWENVPGVLSANGGRDFGTFLGMLAELGYGFAYRVLDAKNFGVPQRRRRVFVVGHLGDWKRAAAVLFEPESVPRDFRAGREEGKGVRPESVGCAGRGGKWPAIIASTLGADYARNRGIDNQHVNSNCPLFVADNAATITASPSSTYSPNVASGQGDVIAFDAYNQSVTGQLSKTMAARSDQDTASCLSYGKSIRRLTVIECERLQGFSDNFTKIPYRGKTADKCPDGPRYKALGNSMAVPCMKWIGERIQAVQDTTQATNTD